MLLLVTVAAVLQDDVKENQLTATVMLIVCSLETAVRMQS